MKTLRLVQFCAKRIKWLMLPALLAPALAQAATIEETFAVLKIGPETYQNVTVTTKAKDYIFIMHSSGMSNIKVSDLSPEVRDKLGYAAATAPGASGKSGGKAVSTWAKNALAKVDGPRWKQFSETLRHNPQVTLASANAIPVMIALGLGYLLFCYCGMLICQKTGNEPGVLIWLPILQLIPLLRAAGMSPGWLVAFLLPLINVIGFIVWASNIAAARNKSGWVALFLILPVTNLFAFLYLAFSKGTPTKEGKGSKGSKGTRRMEIMTLETA